ncbi:hypothetical protein HMPREF9184_01228 [Streptococcus sp. oral taxon 058 str. F0407]|nr:hypothetical protein HMPREF9184_01228 [Streptococcus sp. oral taxon 058 str. F0407]
MIIHLIPFLFVSVFYISIILPFKRTFKQFTEFLKKYLENFGKIILTLYEAFICFTKQNNSHIFFYYDNKTFVIFQFLTGVFSKNKNQEEYFLIL